MGNSYEGGSMEDGSELKPEKFIAKNLGPIETTGEQEKFGYKVGEELVLKKEAGDFGGAENAKEIKVVGFYGAEGQDDVVIQLDGDDVLVVFLTVLKNTFERAPLSKEEHRLARIRLMSHSVIGSEKHFSENLVGKLETAIKNADLDAKIGVEAIDPSLVNEKSGMVFKTIDGTPVRVMIDGKYL